MKTILPLVILIFIGTQSFIHAQSAGAGAAGGDSTKVAGVERSAAFIKAGVPDVKIYPNPTDGEITIDFDNPTYQERVELLDILGNLVFESPYHKTINLSHLTKGMYFLKLFDKDNRLMVMERVIKK